MNSNEGKGQIYLLTNIITRKQYVGQAKFSQRLKYSDNSGAVLRWNKHIWNAYYQKKGRQLISNVIRKYGKENFEMEIILKCNEDELDYFEGKYIEEYDTLVPNGYNIMTGGSVSRRGVKLSDEIKKRIGEGNRGKVRSEEYKKNMSEIKMGTKKSQETIEKTKQTNLAKFGVASAFQNTEVREKYKETCKEKYNGCVSPMQDPEYVFKKYGNKRLYDLQLQYNHLLPPYVRVLVDKKSGAEGFRINKHPTVANKVFVSMKVTMDEKFKLALEYVKQDASGSS
jgi:group I intron endonuclease